MLGSLVYCLAISGLMWPSSTATSHTHASWSQHTVRTLQPVWPNTPRLTLTVCGDRDRQSSQSLISFRKRISGPHHNLTQYSAQNGFKTLSLSSRYCRGVAPVILFSLKAPHGKVWLSFYMVAVLFDSDVVRSTPSEAWMFGSVTSTYSVSPCKPLE